MLWMRRREVSSIILILQVPFSHMANTETDPLSHLQDIFRVVLCDPYISHLLLTCYFFKKNKKKSSI